MYQGRFKSFPIQEDQHLLTVLRYVERNALRAKLVASAEAWRWCSLWHRLNGVAAGLVDEGPVPLSRNWRRHVPLPQREAELAALRQSVVRGDALRRGVLAGGNGQATALGIDTSPTWPPEEGSAGRGCQRALRLPTPL